MNHIPATPLYTAPPSHISLLALQSRILADSSILPGRQADMASALRCLAKALGRPLNAISADPVVLRALLKGVTPAMAGHQPGRWRNIVSLVGAALRYAGSAVVPGRFEHPPSPGWAAILDLLGPDTSPRFQLGRFGRYCTLLGIEPAGIDDAVLTRYLADLTTQSLVQDPARAARDTAVHWNRAAAAHAGWPQQRLTIADNRDTYLLPWEAFPPTLRQDISAWLDWLGRDPLADRDFRPLRPTSLATRLRQIRGYISGLVHQGEDPSTLVNLAAVSTPARALKAIEFILGRAGANRTSLHASQVAGVILSVARHWTKAVEADINRLRRLTRNTQPRHTGMTMRNRDRLRQLQDPKKLDALLALPEQICAEVRRAGAPSVRLAQQWQVAVTIELLLCVPIRLTNLAQIRIGTHLICPKRGAMTLCFAPEEVKNSMPLEADVPPVLARMLDTYFKHYRPLLGAADSDWLFPGQTRGRGKTHEGLRHPLRKAIAGRCGIAFNPHLFRHLAAMILLTENPGAYAQAQRILGHKSISTTIAFYSGMETKAALQHFDRLIEARRANAQPGRRPGKRSTQRRLGSL